MNGFSRRTEGKKAAILEIALQELRAGSFGMKLIKEIASDAKVSQVSIYNYFGSKDELLFAAMKGVLDDKLTQYREHLRNETEFTRLIAVLMKEEAEIVRFVQACLRQSADSLSLQGKVEAYQSVMLVPFLLELMDHGKREGFIAKDLEESELLFYFGMYQREWSLLMEAAASGDLEGGAKPAVIARESGDAAEAGETAALETTGAANGSVPRPITEERLVRFFFRGLMG